MACTMTEGIRRSQYATPAVALDVAETELREYTQYGEAYSREVVTALDRAADAIRAGYPELVFAALDNAYKAAGRQ